MKSLNPFAFLLLCSVLFFSCLEDKLSTPVSEDTTKSISPVQNSVTELMDATGLHALILEKPSWEKLHQNYLEQTTKFKGHQFLFSYKQTLIFHQIQKTDLLTNLTKEKVDALKLYLQDLESFRKGYPMISYKLLHALKPYLENAEIQAYSIAAYEKGRSQMEKAKIELERLKNNATAPEHFIQHFEQDYKDNYVIYLPKLKDLSFIEG